MKLVITCDHRLGDQVDVLVDELNSRGPRERFLGKDYGAGLTTIGVVFRCLPKSVAGYDRGRLNRKTKFYGINLRLFHEEFASLPLHKKRSDIRELLQNNFLSGIRSCAAHDFDAQRFADDFSSWLAEIDWGHS